MYFLIRYGELPGTSQIRTDLRPDHIAFRKGLGDALVMAGSLLTDDGVEVIGSLILIRAQNKDDAAQIAGADPYVINGVFTVEDVTAYRIAAIRPSAEP